MKPWLMGLAVALPVLGCRAAAGLADDNPGDALLGKAARSVALKSTDGKMVDPGRSFGKKPVVLIFYKGVW